jgi:hypothetical protein
LKNAQGNTVIFGSEVVNTDAECQALIDKTQEVLNTYEQGKEKAVVIQQKCFKVEYPTAIESSL